jgi:hypothetical protein
MASNNRRSAIQVFSHALRRPVGIQHAQNNEHKSANQYTNLKPKSYKQKMAISFNICMIHVHPALWAVETVFWPQ